MKGSNGSASKSPSQQHYDTGRKLMAVSDYEGAVREFRASLELTVHFKTLELLGECYIQLRQFTEAIVTLAAATTLNRGVRAPSLLCELLANQSDPYLVGLAEGVIDIALSRDPSNRRAITAKKEISEKGLGSSDSLTSS